MENSAKAFDVFDFKEGEELPDMVVTRVCSKSAASEALNIHKAFENGKGLYVPLCICTILPRAHDADNNNKINANNLLLLVF